MRLLISLIVACVFWSAGEASVLSRPLQREWKAWKNLHSKQYLDHSQELTRQAVWLANREYINRHNSQADEHGYTLKMNHLGDLTEEEYQTRYYCYNFADVAPNRTIMKQTNMDDHHHKHLPESVDWRTKGAVSRVKDQGKCGSCYAFSAAGGLEGAHALAHDKLVDLSVQNIVDCSAPYGNSGCNGGNMYKVYQYIIDNRGIDTDKSYPYTGKRGQCRFKKDSVGASQVGIIRLPVGSEPGLQEAVATAGPISVAVDGSSNAFRFYDRGVFDEPNCSTSKLTQAMLVIGYGQHKGKDYWLVKNSWGRQWGMDGYIMMSRGKANQCGIATDASFPTL